MKSYFNRMLVMELIVLVLGICFAIEPVNADSIRGNVAKGNKSFEEGDYEESISRFSQALESDPESAILNYNAGAAYYKNEQYGKAIEHLQKALLSEDEVIKQKAFYNLGNTLYKAGIQFEDSEINGAVKALEESLKSYESSLVIDQEDEDVKNNYEFVKKELKRLKKMQQQEQDKQCDNPKESEDGEQGDKQTQNGSQDQKQNQQQNKDQQQEGDKQQQGSEDDQGQEEQQQKDSAKEGEKDEDDGYNENQDSQENSSQQQSAQPVGAEELSKKEARMLIESYNQTEEPKGLLNVFHNTSSGIPVDKDW